MLRYNCWTALTRGSRLVSYLAALIFLCDLPTAVAQTKGVISSAQVAEGEFLYYIPKSTPVGILVIVHGTPDPGGVVADHARRYLERWTGFAENLQLIVVAPVFDSAYGSLDSSEGVPGGGYRGLYGAKFGADQFLNSVVSLVATQVASFDGRIIIYGHSAGGQFVARYLVRHPERIRCAVMSAPGRFAFPDPAAPWPYGMAPATLEINGNKLTTTPDPKGWASAAALPVAVVVGSGDIDPQPTRPGHRGTTRPEIAQAYVDDMNKLARSNKVVPRWRMITVDEVGHSSNKLTETCQRTILDLLRVSGAAVRR